jgi:exopolyphosphatase/guanosine-5'-triphosphate,3'-diphosphate pyrophosphatase
MAGWTVDAVPSRARGSERLRLAATFLSLASMQIEPNLRLHQATDWALHKRWIALDAQGRAMLAAAVSANGNHCDLPDPLRLLAGEDSLNEAIGWGLAIRLARRLGARSRRSLNVSRMKIEGETLVLELHDTHADLFGIPTEKDLRLLSDHQGMDYAVRIIPAAEWHEDEGDAFASLDLAK